MSTNTHLVDARYGPGDVWSMHPDEAHSLRAIRPGTITLVFETASQRGFSVQFNDAGMKAEKIIPGLVDARGGVFDAL